jgi:hypothetical protein
MNPDSSAGFPPDHPFRFAAKPTPQLRAFVTYLHDALSPEAFREEAEKARRFYDRHAVRLAALQPGIQRGRELQRLVDLAMQQANPTNVSCRRGCAACCHYEVEITGDDAAVLKAAVLSGVEIDRERLALLAARERNSPAWHNPGNPENRCVFLAPDGACRVYADRPATCRKHLVTSPAAACAAPGSEVAIVRILPVELLLSAALAIEGTSCAALPKMLHAALGDR